MAKSKSIKPDEQSAKQTRQSARKLVKPRRASQRVVISIDLANSSLLQLMTEQCRDGTHYITVYRGSRAELAAAGIPESAFQRLNDEFQVQTLNACCTGRRELLQGSMRAKASSYEMEIYWGSVRPYVQAAHPAISELARMMLIDILAWTEKESLTAPMEELATDPRAEYKPRAGLPRLQVTAEFLAELNNLARYVHELVHSKCEVMPVVEIDTRSPNQQPALDAARGSSPRLAWVNPAQI